MIKEFHIIVHRNKRIDFQIDPIVAFKSFGVSLLGISALEMYGDTNWITRNQEHLDMIALLQSVTDSTKIIDLQNTLEYSFYWGYDCHNYISDHYLYLEKWGLCTRLALNEYKNFLLKIEEFFRRWTNTEEFILAVKKVFKNRDKKLSVEEFRSVQKSKKGDFIIIGLNESDFNSSSDEFIKKLILPHHMTDTKS